MPGPTFVCQFVDGVVTRMTTHCPDGLDPARGIRLSRAAYESRRRRPPPEILKGHFENDDGVVVQTYDAAAIAAVDNNEVENSSGRQPENLQTRKSRSRSRITRS